MIFLRVDNRVNRVTFVDSRVENALIELERGPFEDKVLSENIRQAIQKLKENPQAGICIPSRLWPREYVVKYHLNNLWKLDLRSGWRLIYFLKGNDIEVVSLIIEWIDYASYNRTFHYH